MTKFFKALPPPNPGPRAAAHGERIQRSSLAILNEWTMPSAAG